MNKIPLLSLLLTLFACGQPAALTETEKKPIIEEVRKTFDNYYNDVRKHGLTAEFKYLDSSEDFFWVPPGFGGPISYDSIVAILTPAAKQFRRIDNVPDTIRIIPVSREIAIYTAKLHSNTLDTSGNNVLTGLLETGVVIKRKDGWKLLSGQTSILKK
jgi:hypothetical protein